MKKPNLFIVGEPKSGTTPLLKFLDQHPDIFMSDLEIPVFARDLVEANRKFHARRFWRRFRIDSVKKYRQVAFSKARGERYWGEATTANLYSKVAAKNIYRFNPEAKIIIMLREPVSFLYSWHSQLVFNLDEDESDFEKALSLEDERKKGCSIPSSAAFPDQLFYSERVKYADHVKRYMDLFPKDRLMILILDDFMADNVAVTKKVYHFLGIDEKFNPVCKTVNPNKELRSRFLKSLVDNLHILPFMQMIFPKRFHDACSRAYYAIVCKKTRRKRLSPELKKELKSRYKHEVEKVSRLIGVNLVKKWGYDRIR